MEKCFENDGKLKKYFFLRLKFKMMCCSSDYCFFAKNLNIILNIVDVIVLYVLREVTG